MGGDELADVGAVIVTHSRPDLAVRAASNVVEVLGDAGRVAVVVNLAEHAPAVDLLGVRVVVNDEPVGYGANLNRGEATLPPAVRAVLLLNDDVLLDRAAVARLVRALDDPRAGLVGPAMVGPDGVTQQSSFRLPTIASEVAEALLGPTRLVRWARRHVGRDVDAASVEWVQGAAMLVRRRAFREVGGFDEGFHLYFEEADLAARLAGAGWRVVHVPDAVIVHDGHATLGSAHLASYGASRARFLRKHWPTHRTVLLRLALNVAYAWDIGGVAVGTLLGTDRRGERRAALRALLDRRPRWSLTSGGATAPPPP